MEEVESSGSSPLSVGDRKAKKESVRVKRETLQAVLEQCQRALELLSNGEVEEDGDEGVGVGDGDGSFPDVEPGGDGLATPRSDCEADELCDLLKSRVECPDFLEKLECAQVSIPCNAADEGGAWDIVSHNDLWEGENMDPSEQDYVVVRQEDIVEGIAGFMAAYLLSLKQTKELTPNQLQEALCKTFSVKNKKGKLRKAWDGSRVIYNVASWGATAIGIYQNPVILQAASKAFWASCDVISKLL
ncbi:uncharacterized protein LOC115739498 isoform X2 [Rhodamnia argentea]|uniref:Uncharacterized protein LOC115739498 isoform X2 n=1 Tax=Rhodamnia argentea TaxID=178133 RepID=A0A8B8P0W4_9MYRT|nr:uncharacterized protein LOC115739498 isoform X2 [Rhodamnia argentea]